MPDKIISVPGLGNVAFPDTMKDEEIAGHIQRQTGAQTPVGGWKVLNFTNDMLSNIPASGARLVGDAANAVMHPIDTTKAIGGLAMGVVEKGIPGEQEHERNVDALVDLYKGRYGDWDKFAETLKTDPAGVLADLSTIAGGVGAAAKGVQVGANVAKAGRLANTAGKVARIAGEVAAAADPLALPIKGVQAAATATGIPERLYRTALRGGYDVRTPATEVREWAKTGLEHSIPVTEGGVRKLYDLILGYNQRVQDIIQPAAQRGVTIDPLKAWDPLVDVEKKAGMQVYPTDDLKDVQKVGDAWIRNHSSGPIPVDQAQAIKVGTYERLKDEYRKGHSSEAFVEAQKAVARGVKDEIVAALPELAGLNAKESKLLDLSGPIEKAVNKAFNTTGTGLKTILTGGAVKGISDNNMLAVAAGIMHAVVTDPGVRSRLAIALNYGQRRNPAMRATATLGTALSRIKEYEDALEQGMGGGKDR